ncbi:hypothetical protein CH282_28340 [Rhodococcus sp. 06-418-1B]|nr:hypothetical protein CH282_28340 [Rhodococcus sp. 06-418-1B]
MSTNMSGGTRIGASAIVVLAFVFGVGTAGISGAAPSPDVTTETVGVGPEASTRNEALLYAQLHPDAAPAGSNDFGCAPSEEHPEPVVLVHGTYSTAYGTFASLSPALKAQGYCVFALNYGEEATSAAGLLQRRGVASVARSAHELSVFVDGVLERTGAEKVDIVGHSQGALVARQYLRFGDGAPKVGSVVSLSGSNHGTTLGSRTDLAPDPNLGSVLGQAAVDQTRGSPFLEALDAGGDTEPGVDYTVVASTGDTTVTPWESTFLTAGPGATVRNITLNEPVDHSSVPYSPEVLAIVLVALQG